MMQAASYKTVANWNIVLRKFECFQHPNLSVQCGKRPLPRVLEVYPCAKEQITAFGVENWDVSQLKQLPIHPFFSNPETCSIVEM
jgi:hypothetical protein